jgi:hypothetical protein
LLILIRIKEGKEKAMKRLVIFIVFIISTGFLFAQGNDENSTLSRKEKRKAEAEKQFELTKQMLENKSFVLESYYLQDRYGNRIPVMSDINFVAIDSTEAIIQIGSNWRIGPNGVGGVTAKGQITKWELSENEKNQTFTLRMNVMTPIGFYDLMFSILGSGKSTALLTGLRSGRLTFDGDLVPWSDSSIYVGRSL